MEFNSAFKELNICYIIKVQT